MRTTQTLIRSSRLISRSFAKGAVPALRQVNVAGFQLQPTQIRWNSISITTEGVEIPESVKNLTLEQYDVSANETLESVYCDLDDFFDTKGISDADVEESGSYVLNKQPPNKQLWLSSPISGPKRFDLVDGKWISIRDNLKLLDILQTEINDIYGDFEFTSEF
ncbi:hypothetical protein OGAPHI_002053 [Ogataea philodendri]|uniref:Ferroxidase n=1 Tax=Ogataea philodendri TaxID=1378263 RepID=A0A9P8T7B5_9ASCO|nr:uncharacterized protein OGAPHI_002053 [Ogataea philodendri]KAH3668299.1 hypothetical protein OGAPHI_002053 [Ogataea philodendri]